MPIPSSLDEGVPDLSRKRMDKPPKQGADGDQPDPHLKRRRTLSRSDQERDDDEQFLLEPTRRLRSSLLGDLYPGSRFRGIQKSETTNYDVIVDIQHVDIRQSTLSGYLYIKGLTVNHPELTTFFDAEIIGPTYPFCTRKWKAKHSTDTAHWGRFPSFEPLLHSFEKEGFVYDPTKSDHVYMRWKEHFIVPDHHVGNIDGASYDGFYYICYQRSTHRITGFYFAQQTKDLFQELVLDHVPQRSFSHFEFR